MQTNVRLVKNGMIYDFAKVRDYMYLLEISIEAFEGKWVSTSAVISESEAISIYNKLNK